MKFAGIIAEYDPFHNGHAWQLAQAKVSVRRHLRRHLRRRWHCRHRG